MSTRVIHDRSARLAELVTAAQLDAAVISDLVNVRYLTGYTGSNGLAVVGPDVRRFVTDFRYLEQAASQVDPSFDRLQAPVDLLEGLAGALPEGAFRLGFEAAHISVEQHGLMRERLAGDVELVATAGLVESLRAVKDAAEIAAVRAASAVADASFEQLVQRGL